MSVLIVCRGPIRKEAIDVFREMGMTKVGILLSERDSIVYPARALARAAHHGPASTCTRVPDYTGATKEERVQRIEPDDRRSAASTATATSSPATASWPRTPTSCARSRRPA